MAEITHFRGYQSGDPSEVPPPDQPVDPMIVTVQDGVPVAYSGCQGLGVRVVHPSNPKAPGKNLAVVMFYVPPHAVLAPSSHAAEETYVILEGSGRMTFGGFQREVKKGDFVYLPPWCVHGIENTGLEPLVVLIAGSPPNP